MDHLISQLLDLPDQVHRGDFVLNLSEGVTAGKAERTLADYVVTPQLADAFDNALGFITRPRLRPRRGAGVGVYFRAGPRLGAPGEGQGRAGEENDMTTITIEVPDKVVPLTPGEAEELSREVRLAAALRSLDRG